METSMNLFQKLVEVRKSVPYLKKDAEMSQGQNYKYNSSSQVIAAVRAKLDDLNVLLITKIIDKRVHLDTIEYEESKNGQRTGKPKRTTTYFTELDLMMVWVNTDNPSEIIEIPWYGQGIDTAGEKGVGKALTYAEKTFFLKEFNIPTDHMDVDSFNNLVESTSGVKPPTTITSNAIAQLKMEWVGAGYKINTLTNRVKELYNCSTSELSIEQADELIAKIRDKKAGKSA